MTEIDALHHGVLEQAMAEVGAVKARIVQYGVGEVGFDNEGLGQSGMRKIGAPRRHVREINAGPFKRHSTGLRAAS